MNAHYSALHVLTMTGLAIGLLYLLWNWSRDSREERRFPRSRW